MMDNAQQRNDIEDCLLTWSSIPQIVKRMVDLLSKTGVRPSKTINSRNRDPKATHSNSIVVEPPCNVRNIDLASALLGMTILMNDHARDSHCQ